MKNIKKEKGYMVNILAFGHPVSASLLTSVVAV